MVPVLAAAAALLTGPAAAIAATTSTDSISGLEYAATSAQGRFAGIASGALPGAWSVTVDHTPLGTAAAITGGAFHLATRLDGTLTVLTGDFTRGTVTQLSGFTGCAGQQYAVTGVLGDVGPGSAGRNRHLRGHPDALPHGDLRAVRDVLRERQRIAVAGLTLTTRSVRSSLGGRPTALSAPGRRARSIRST